MLNVLLVLFCFANAAQICGESSDYKWCARPGRAVGVIYFLHGYGGNETEWDTPDHRRLEKIWGERTPTIVSISNGTLFFFSERSVARLVSEVIPAIESKLNIRAMPRLLYGQSMGGFNAIEALMHAPTFFTRIAAACPALMPFAPQASDSELDAFIARHQPYVDERLVYKWRDKLQGFYPTAADWRRNDPFSIRAATTPVFVYANGNDVFGFQEGAEKLRAHLVQVGEPVEFRLLPASAHCATDSETLRALADFLVP